MAKTYEFEGLVPVIDPTAFVHPDAVLIGDVIIGPRCYVGPLASLRGDFGRVVLMAGSNVQDCCVIHEFPGRETLVGEDGHVGHGAVLHTCSIGRGVLIGMQAIILDGATVGDYAFVAAGSLVKADFAVPPGTLAAGSPARVVRELTEAELAWKANGTRVYQELAQRSLATLRPAAPLGQPEAGRPVRAPAHDIAVPLREYRNQG